MRTMRKISLKDFHENHIHLVNTLTCVMFYRASFGVKKNEKLFQNASVSSGSMSDDFIT